MLKLSRTGQGLLNAQYRSVLRKCMLLNLSAAFLVMSTGIAMADGKKDVDSSDTAEPIYNNLINKMGNNVNTDLSDYSALYVHGTFGGNIYSDTTNNYAWINNYGETKIGYKIDGGDEATTISGRHNKSADSIYAGGGVVSSGGNPVTGNGIDASLTIYNTVLSQNSSSCIGPSCTTSDPVVGGAVDNFGINEGANSISNSRFLGNYVMIGLSGTTGGEQALGGAVYNGATINGLGSIDLSNNTFEGNYVGNILLPGEDPAVKTTLGWDGTTSALYSAGGAVYNSGIMSSTDDTYLSNFVLGDTAIGGAVYNGPDFMAAASKLTLSGTIKFGETGKGNSAVSTSDATGAKALGGAVANNATINTSGATLSFVANSATADHFAEGGAVYNDTNGNLTLSGTFSDNFALATSLTNANSIAAGGAIGNQGTLNITDATFSDNKTQGIIAAGGAIASHGKTSTVENSSFTDNTVEAVGLGIGGTIFNSSNNELTTLKDSSVTNSKVVIAEISGLDARGVGGAIANETTSTNISLMKIQSVNNSVSISNNSIEAKAGTSGANEKFLGGAVYNGTRGQLTVESEKGVDISHNKAGFGGAIYNEADGTSVLDGAGNSVTAFLTLVAAGDDINITNNEATNSGGALYNNSGADGVATLTANSSDINIENNTAQKGGAIYNTEDSKVVLQLRNGDIKFSNNTATEAGAIYNETNGQINVSLRDNAKLVFDTTKDDVYNLGTVTITGESTPSSSSGGRKYIATSTGSVTQVVLNSTFGGTGLYDISNTLFNMGSTGYIDYEPTFKLKENKINLASGSYMKLDAGDTLNNNDFAVASSSKLYYRASSAKPDVDLANNLVNSGLVDLGDGIISKVVINTLRSNDGTIHIDVDNASYTADVLKISNRIYGTTNVVFDNQTTLELDDQKIYFAQTQADQDLADYKFKTYVDNGLYEIKVGYEENGLVYDWFLYRELETLLEPETIAYIDLPRSAIEQTRSIVLDLSRTNKGVCNCSGGACNRAYCRYGDDGTKYRLWAKPTYRKGTFDKPIETDFKLQGIDFGLDVQPTTSDMYGVFGSYRKGTYENNGGEGKYRASGTSELNIDSIMAGLYYRKYFGNLFLEGAVYGGQQDVDVKADNGVTASVSGLNIGAMGEVGYDIRTSNRSLLIPSIKATYDYIKFDDLTDSDGKKAEFDTVSDVELEAGIKYEYQFNNERELPTTAYIKPSVIQTLASGGKVTVAGKEFDDTLDNETLGRIEIGGDAEIIRNLSIGAFGNYTFGSAYKAWNIGGNLKYVW